MGFTVAFYLSFFVFVILILHKSKEVKFNQGYRLLLQDFFGVALMIVVISFLNLLLSNNEFTFQNVEIYLKKNDFLKFCWIFMFTQISRIYGEFLKKK